MTRKDMSRILTLVALAALAVSCRAAVSAPEPETGGWLEDPYAAIAENPLLGGGEYNMYPEDLPAPPKAPKGYKPFYISHFGRHGARFDNGGYDDFHKIITAAHADSALTPLGESVYRRYEAQYPYFRLREGDLTRKGQRQQYGIADRMVRQYPGVFRGPRRIEAVSSTSNRSQLTMSYFCEELVRKNPRLETHMDFSRRNMAFASLQSDYNPGYAPSRTLRTEPGPCRAAYERDFALLSDRVDTVGIVLKVFRTLEDARRYGRLMDLARRFYYLAVSTSCTDSEEDFHDLLTPEQFASLWEPMNLFFYAHFGPGPYFRETQWACADTLLSDIVCRAEEDFGNDVAVRARFGHDVNLMALLALLQAPGYSAVIEDPLEVKHVWQDWDFPMSVNLQLVFFRNRRGNILVLPLFNEEPLEIPVIDESGEPVDGPFYPWPAFREWSKKRIALARAILSSSM